MNIYLDNHKDIMESPECIFNVRDIRANARNTITTLRNRNEIPGYVIPSEAIKLRKTLQQVTLQTKSILDNAHEEDHSLPPSDNQASSVDPDVNDILDDIDTPDVIDTPADIDILDVNQDPNIDKMMLGLQMVSIPQQNTKYTRNHRQLLSPQFRSNRVTTKHTASVSPGDQLRIQQLHDNYADMESIKTTCQSLLTELNTLLTLKTTDLIKVYAYMCLTKKLPYYNIEGTMVNPTVSCNSGTLDDTTDWSLPILQSAEKLKKKELWKPLKNSGKDVIGIMTKQSMLPILRMVLEVAKISETNHLVNLQQYVPRIINSEPITPKDTCAGINALPMAMGKFVDLICEVLGMRNKITYFDMVNYTCSQSEVIKQEAINLLLIRKIIDYITSISYWTNIYEHILRPHIKSELPMVYQLYKSHQKSSTS